MKLEFLADALDGAGLLLLHSGCPSEAERLRGQVSELVTPGLSIRVHALDFIDAQDSCELTFSSVKCGRGVQPSSHGRRFDLQLDPSEWERVGDLLEPFCLRGPDASSPRFQYLHEHDGIEVIYSTARTW